MAKKATSSAPTKPKQPARKYRNQFAEMYVAGCFMDAGWQVFFPQRDEGFDFIVAKRTANGTCLRPVQVRGCYRQPDAKVKNKATYGKGTILLSQIHSDMVVAIPFFSEQSPHYPHGVAYLRLPDLKTNSEKGNFYSYPAQLRDGVAQARPSYAGLFGAAGLARLEADSATLDGEILPE